MTEIVVIGAGVVGAFVARELSFYRDVHVTVLEKENDVAMGASKANSAIVHAGFDAVPGTLKARLNVRGSEIMEKVAHDLGVRYQRNGSIVLGFAEEDLETLRTLLERGRINGVRDLSLIESREELVSLLPNAGETARYALYAPTGAIICPYALTVAAMGNAMDNGATLCTSTPVTAIETLENGYSVLSGEACFRADYVINCAGVFSDAVAAMVGDTSFTVNPRRGEYMVLDKECGSLVGKTVFQCPSALGKGILVTPTVDGNLLVGPTAENIGDKTDTATTKEGLSKVATLSVKSVCDLPLHRVITSFSGLRAVGSTGDFVIRKAAPRFLHCAGIESPGLSASPAIAEYVAELLSSEGILSEKRPDALTTRPSMHTFRDMSDEEKAAVIEQDPRYGRIVCRCEGITEGEIVRALHENPRPTDLDGIKRRTRSGMGRCQGGFCAPVVAEIIARETGIPYKDVTKFGGASRLNLTKLGEEDRK